MKAIIESVKQRILSRTPIQDVRRFNNQITKMENGSDVLFLPSVLVEVTDITYHHKDRYKQLGNCQLKVHVITEEYNADPDINDALAGEVNKALQNYSDGIHYHPLERTDETVDDDYSNMVVYTVQYNMSFCDYPVVNDESTKVYLDLDVNVESKTTSGAPIYTGKELT